MSVKIGIIITKIFDINILQDFLLKYDLGFNEISNSYVKEQLQEDEIFLQATASGLDNYTGIGAYNLYNKDSSLIYHHIDDTRLAQTIIDELKERKQNYKADVLKWIEIINDLKNHYKVDKLGLFWHMCSSSFEQDYIIFCERIYCDLKDLTIEFMMKIKPDTIVFFTNPT